MDAVYFHGKYWALNNRHAVALIEFARRSVEQGQDLPVCQLRCWPLVTRLLAGSLAGSGEKKPLKTAEFSLCHAILLYISSFYTVRFL